MCILFLYVAKTQSVSSSSPPHVKLIIASNRDEAYARPTIAANFWESDPNILGGKDGKDGGTWLGITKTGKLCTLLNIMSKPLAEKVKSRGDLVTGFLRSDLRGWTYCTNLHQDVDLNIRNHFGLFNLLTIDLLPLSPDQNSQNSSKQTRSEAEVVYLTNANDSGPLKLTEGESQTFAFGNSTYESPFCKVSHGCKEFETIIQTHKESCLTSDDGKAACKSNLLTFLKSQERHFPDKEMNARATNAGISMKILPELSSRFVKTTSKTYGTRTHTIIIVDSNNNVNFHEWTLEEPIDIDNPHWIESEYSFKI